MTYIINICRGHIAITYHKSLTFKGHTSVHLTIATTNGTSSNKRIESLATTPLAKSSDIAQLHRPIHLPKCIEPQKTNQQHTTDIRSNQQYIG